MTKTKHVVSWCNGIDDLSETERVCFVIEKIKNLLNQCELRFNLIPLRFGLSDGEFALIESEFITPDTFIQRCDVDGELYCVYKNKAITFYRKFYG